jgi:hypothetical protein
MLHDYDANEDVRLPKAALGDVRTGHAIASSTRQWKAGVASDGYPWWSSGNGGKEEVDPTIIVETSRHP